MVGVQYGVLALMLVMRQESKFLGDLDSSGSTIINL